MIDGRRDPHLAGLMPVVTSHEARRRALDARRQALLLMTASERPVGFAQCRRLSAASGFAAADAAAAARVVIDNARPACIVIGRSRRLNSRTVKY